jgi:hypothetical protein
MKQMKKIDWTEFVLSLILMVQIIFLAIITYQKMNPEKIIYNPMKTQVFKMMVEDFNKLKAGEGDQKELQRRLNIESNYLIGTPMPKGNK